MKYSIKFSIHPSSGSTCIGEILSAQAKFVIDSRFPPSEVVVHPSDFDKMKNNQKLLSISPRGKLLNSDGSFTMLPNLVLRVSKSVEVGSAILEGQI